MQNPMNTLVVQADQLAARALAAYGNPICKTPVLDQVAASGTVFSNLSGQISCMALNSV